MKYTIFSAIFFLISSTAGAAGLLQLDQYSGYVVPGAALETHCSFFVDAKDGLLKITSEVHKGRSTNGTWIYNYNTQFTPSKAELDQAGIWMTAAAAGPFQQSHNPCDIGTYKIMTANYPLIDSEDCGKKVVNLNPAAAPLIAWFTKACFPIAPPISPSEGTQE